MRRLACAAIVALLSAATCVATCVATPALASPRHVRRSPARSVCVHRIHRVRVHGRITRVPVRTCIRLVEFIPVSSSPPAASGSFAGLPATAPRAPVGDDEPAVPIAPGPLVPFGRRPATLTLGGLPGAADARAAAGGVSLTNVFDLAGGPFGLDASGNVLAGSGLELAEMLQSSETSVAYAPGNVVMYTANGGSASGFGAAYSINGGITFHRLYATALVPATSIFPYPTYPQQPGSFGCSPLCDQVVTYDKYNNMFIWVLQYPQNSAAKNNPNFQRIAYASPQALIKHGAAAWSYTDLQSTTISSTTFLDQPRLGVTPKWVYISFNQPRTTILRIAHNALKDLTYTRSPGGFLIARASKIPAGAIQVVNAATCPGCGLRVARSTDGINPGGSYREYFGGIGTTASSVDVASVADDSNLLVSQNVKTWGMAITNGASLTDWGSLVPSGGNWMYRTSNTIANPSVTESHGILFVAWSEGRTVYNSKNQPTDVNGAPLRKGVTTYTQPHIGVAGFIDNSSYSSTSTNLGTIDVAVPNYTLYYSNEFANASYALAMPELATAADGEVAMGFYAGGGPSNTSTQNSIYVAHGVGFLWGGPGDPVFRTDATSDSFTTDNLNVYGDYNNITPLASNGDCLVSSAVVTQTVAARDQPVFTLFSHPGHYCPKVSRPTNVPLRITTHLNLTCTSPVTAGSVVLITGQLTPVPRGGAPVTVTVTGGPGGGTQSLTANPSGTFTATFIPGAAGSYSVAASFAGDFLYAPSTSACPVTVNPLPPSTISMNCQVAAAPGDQVTLTAALLSPAVQGANVTWTATAPDGTATSQVDPTDSTATSYFTLTVGQPGTWHFSAFWPGDSTHAPATGTCSFPVQTPTTLTVNCPTNPLMPLTSASINGTLSPAVGNEQITVAYAAPASGGTSGTDVVTTDNTGFYADSYGQDGGGVWTVTATFGGNATEAPAHASCTFTVLGG